MGQGKSVTGFENQHQAIYGDHDEKQDLKCPRNFGLSGENPRPKCIKCPADAHDNEKDPKTGHRLGVHPKSPIPLRFESQDLKGLIGGDSLTRRSSQSNHRKKEKTGKKKKSEVRLGVIRGYLGCLCQVGKETLYKRYINPSTSLGSQGV